MARVYTDPAKWAEAVRRWQLREKDKPLINAIRRGVRFAADLAAESFRHGGVGHRIFGRKAAGLKKLIHGSTERHAPGDPRYVGFLKAKGLAAIQESGGRTAPHVIKGSGKLMVFEVSGRRGFFGIGRRRGGVVAARVVHHPGARHPRMPFLHSALRRAEPRISAELKSAIARSAERVIG